MKQIVSMIIAAFVTSTALCDTIKSKPEILPETGQVRIQLIRNATMKLTYAGKTFLTDPMLSQKGEIRSFAGIASNPTVELPLSSAEIIACTDALIISHLHPDHYHKAAEQKTLLAMPLFCQPADSKALSNDGFIQTIPVSPAIEWENIKISRVGGKHGSDSIVERMGEVCGFVLRQKTCQPFIGPAILSGATKLRPP
jgi:L-ascorbate metabolism protein UlaG (beta-lactamase superfamily)